MLDVSAAAPATHGADMAACTLRALGVPYTQAEAIAHRPLPAFPPPGTVRPEAPPTAASAPARRPRAGQA